MPVFVLTAKPATYTAQDKPEAPTPQQSAVPFTSSFSTEEARAPHKSDKNKDALGKDGQSQTTGTSNDRLFFTLPNFLTLENANQVPPLSTGQKYRLVVRSSFTSVLSPSYGSLPPTTHPPTTHPDSFHLPP